MAAAGFSLEATRPSERELDQLCDWLVPGTEVYLSHVPAQPARERVEAAARLRRAGFEPVAHLAARRITTASELAEFVARLRGEADMRRMLVIAGDTAAAGPYPDALAVIRSGDLSRAGIEEIGIAGYPEDHPAIARAALQRAMADKIAAARAVGLGLHIVTQFSFSPDAIVDFLRRLRAADIDVPVKVGMAGPTRLPSLLRYAMRCGVKASMQGVASGAAAALVGRLAKPVGPERILDALHAAGGTLGAVVPHYFSFGGLIETARYASSAGRQPSGHAIRHANQESVP